MTSATNSTLVGKGHDAEQAMLRTAFLISGTTLAVICPLTILANVLLLIAICKDPFKTFRTPTACFLVGLAITNLVTGVLPEPMVTTCYFLLYQHHPKQIYCPRVFQIAGIVAAITTNVSFFIVMVFTLVQYVAVAFPLKYKRLISVRKTILCVVFIWAYATLFEVLQAVGVPKEVLEKIDLHLHSTFTLLLTICAYVLLQKAFRKQMMKRSQKLNAFSTITTSRSQDSTRRQKRKPLVEKKFVRMNLVLIIILLVCSQPSALLWYVFLYSGEDTRSSKSLFIARIIVDNTLYLKFLLDPFVFAWRLPKYRKALKKVLCRGG